MESSAIQMSVPEPAVRIPFIANGEKQAFLECSSPPPSTDSQIRSDESHLKNCYTSLLSVIRIGWRVQRNDKHSSLSKLVKPYLLRYFQEKCPVDLIFYLQHYFSLTFTLASLSTIAFIISIYFVNCLFKTGYCVSSKVGTEEERVSTGSFIAQLKTQLGTNQSLNL